MKVKDLVKYDDESYILLDAGEVWDLEVSLEGRKAVYVKPLENEMQIGAKEYINGLIKLKISQLKDNIEIEILNEKKCEMFKSQIEILVKLYNSLEWNQDDKMKWGEY